MRKGLIVLLAAVVVVAFALPAMADLIPTNIKVNGFYRSKAWLSNFHDVGGGPSLRTDTPGDSKQTNAYVEQRFRVRFAFGTESVQAVWYLESDMLWGDSAGSAAPGAATRNAGGALGADKVQTETKNIYVWFKVPDTSMEFQVGLQGQSDDYAGVIYGGADMAGIYAKGKLEPVSYRIGWFKLYENAVQKSDDQTLYIASVDLKPVKDARLGLNFYFLQDDSAKVSATNQLPSNPGANTFKARVYMPGVDGSIKAGPATISGFLMYQTGKIEAVNNPAQKDIDISAYMADLRADLAVGPGNAYIEGLYLSGGDDPGDKYKAPITLATRESSPGGNSSYTRLNTAILMASPDTINVSQCLIGCSGGEMGSDLGNSGRGITALGAGYKQKLTSKVTGQFNVAYLAATKNLKTDSADGRSGKSMGTEFNARVDYNIAKGLDVGLVGAYVILGDLIHDPPPAQDFKDPWTSYARINYSF
jgi:hypothetical protein